MSEKISFYNTTGLGFGELLDAIEKAKTQDERVKLIFRTKNRPMGASEVWMIYKTWFNKCPLTSIRRSISTLRWHGIVKPTGEMTTGAYGRAERMWR